MKVDATGETFGNWLEKSNESTKPTPEQISIFQAALEYDTLEQLENTLHKAFYNPDTQSLCPAKLMFEPTKTYFKLLSIEIQKKGGQVKLFPNNL